MAFTAHATFMPPSAHADESEELAPDTAGPRDDVAMPTAAPATNRPTQDRPPESNATPAWKSSSLRPTYDLRANVSLVAMPSQTFHLGGSCSAISGLAPVAIYGQQARDGGRGVGAGAGGRIGFLKRSGMLGSTPLSWWGLRATIGLDVGLYHERLPAGFRRVDGELCSVVAQTDHPVEYRAAVLLLTQASLGLGPVVAFGSSDTTRWRGVVLGLAWAPAIVHAFAFESTSETYVNPLGAEVTVDFATIRARVNEPYLRLAWFIAPPTTDSRPAITTLSVGIASY